MKRYSMPFGTSIGHTPEHIERTARKAIGSIGETTVFQVWPNRASMAKSIRMQESRASRNDDWRACKPLGTTEGY